MARHVAITSTPVVLSAAPASPARARRRARACRPVRRVQVVRAAKGRVRSPRPPNFFALCCCRPPGAAPRTLVAGGGSDLDARGVGSTVARRAFVAGVAARSARVFGDSRVGSVAPEPARLAAVGLQAPRLSNQHLDV